MGLWIDVNIFAWFDLSSLFSGKATLYNLRCLLVCKSVSSAMGEMRFTQLLLKLGLWIFSCWYFSKSIQYKTYSVCHWSCNKSIFDKGFVIFIIINYFSNALFLFLLCPFVNPCFFASLLIVVVILVFEVIAYKLLLNSGIYIFWCISSRALQPQAFRGRYILQIVA